VEYDRLTPPGPPQALVREQLPRLRTEADRAALLANLICEAFGNYMGVVTEESALPPLAQLQVCAAADSSAFCQSVPGWSHGLAHGGDKTKAHDCKDWSHESQYR